MPARNSELPEGTDHIVNGALETETGSEGGTAKAADGFIGSDAGDDTGGSAGGTVAVRQQLRDGASSLKQQATDRIRGFAEDSKDRTTGVLDDFSKIVGEAADSIDERLGDQYGRYARQAADAVSGFAETLRGKNVDELYGDVRGAVRQSPVAAIGIAAAVGFALVRLVKAGIDAGDEDAAASPSGRKTSTRKKA